MADLLICYGFSHYNLSVRKLCCFLFAKYFIHES